MFLFVLSAVLCAASVDKPSSIDDIELGRWVVSPINYSQSFICAEDSDIADIRRGRDGYYILEDPRCGDMIRFVFIDGKGYGEFIDTEESSRSLYFTRHSDRHFTLILHQSYWFADDDWAVIDFEKQ